MLPTGHADLADLALRGDTENLRGVEGGQFNKPNAGFDGILIISLSKFHAWAGERVDTRVPVSHTGRDPKAN